MREGHVRRLAEVANIMLHAGPILIVTGIEFSQEEMDVIKAISGDFMVNIIWLDKAVEINPLSDYMYMFSDEGTDIAQKVMNVIGLP